MLTETFVQRGPEEVPCPASTRVSTNTFVRGEDSNPTYTPLAPHRAVVYIKPKSQTLPHTPLETNGPVSTRNVLLSGPRPILPALIVPRSLSSLVDTKNKSTQYLYSVPRPYHPVKKLRLRTQQRTQGVTEKSRANIVERQE